MQIITKDRLLQAKPEDVRRLAKWLKLETDDLNIFEVVELILDHNRKARREDILKAFRKREARKASHQ